MNKIVREHYPVEKLPEDLRVHFPNAVSVTVEVAEENVVLQAPASRPLSVQEAAELIRGNLGRSRQISRSADDAVAEVRALRDEWDD